MKTIDSNIEAQETIRNAVRESYAAIATNNSSCCAADCCGDSTKTSEKIGYSPDQLSSVPEGANLGLGCGNPIALASLKPGEVVLDLGSGAGLDCFLAAKNVAPDGKVIGVDMTPAMVTKARTNAAKGNYPNVEFRLGEIENLPVADASIDVIISNCVLNLSTDKPRVIREAFRVLRSGGRLTVSDIVARRPLPEKIRNDLSLYSGCMAGASLVSDLGADLIAAGFRDVQITNKDGSHNFIQEWAPNSGIENYVTSAIIEARKP